MLTTGMYLVAVQIELRMDCFELAVEAAHKTKHNIDDFVKASYQCC